MRDISDDTRTMNGLCYEVPFGFLDGDSNLFPVLLNGLYNSATADQFTAPDSGNFNQTIKYGLAASGMSIKYLDKEVRKHKFSQKVCKNERSQIHMSVLRV